jgi:hypothetical protein
MLRSRPQSDDSRFDSLSASPSPSHHRATRLARRRSGGLRLVFRVLRQQLSREPFTEARNRKPLSLPAPFGAHWELRFGPHNRFRAFYALDGERGAVIVLAIGEKVRDRLRIAGREI